MTSSLTSLPLRSIKPYLHFPTGINPYRPRLIHIQNVQLQPLLNYASLHTKLQCHHRASFASILPEASNNDVDEIVAKSLNPQRRVSKHLLWMVVWASISLLAFAFTGNGDANAAVRADSSIKASQFGVKIAGKLRRLGWPDEAIVFALATLPVIELRGAIPVGYWMQLDPLKLTIISLFGNMVPVPLIILHLKKLASCVAGKSEAMSRLLEDFFKKSKEKAGPVEEFQWLGLMLFVAVPFPGTGAWTGAIVASLLDMPFWAAVSANFVGVVVAGLLVNLLVSIGIVYAIVAGFVLFLLSTSMWSILRNFVKSRNS